ncbi:MULTISPECIES: DUF1292 domain-containing protein [Clostridium]|uniref:DUF1292 domain-containing protein n=1 Tax=Clostridium TaxID=1485 RepID=UPI00069CC216|nr:MULTISPECIES: DUF1292 domain-containing protein [Clostridium]KOF56097.1 hypothetical protein AGR56_03940 [Clostridium sp. DMHC 10]MCD2346074.1 DUF1292 domain-containing protein [Clostridium guangxiense]
MENDVDKITLLDEDGKENTFEVVTKMDIEDNEYVIVIPENAPEDSEAIILKIDKDENGDDILFTVEDDDEFKIVSEAYEALFSGDSE